MINQINSLSESEPEISDRKTNNRKILEKIVSGLSCLLSKNPLDLMNVGILIYDSFSINEPIEKKIIQPLVNEPRAISLRSKSTRNLNIRNNSFSNLLKSYKHDSGKQEVDGQNSSKIFDNSEDLDKSRSRSRLTPINERRKKKTPYETRKNKHILQDVYNIKYKRNNKSIRNTSKETESRRTLTKMSKFASLSPSKYT
ncbi:hypothetical protein SteCoe_2597 [Stentor coeruleus]|uniref:Uncharacterized protein n=1 Tax=Stentor coeruleus TaxID=5963 RepID=A0A1R2CZ31_9CILI|nr:hypothetical protein SteCoe_2597 [Stentor coeruleus]